MIQDVRKIEKRIHAYISGRVQGVGFRWFVVETVRHQYPGISGWVKNLYDGRVEILAEGTENDLIAFIKTMEKGPSFSHVTSLNIDWEDSKGELYGFDVNY